MKGFQSLMLANISINLPPLNQHSLRSSMISFFLKENGRHPFKYGIWPRQRTRKEKKIPEAVRRTLMKLLDIESKPGNWRCLAESLGASCSDIQFLGNRNHESPTQHVLNVFETMNKPLTFLRDFFIGIDRYDVVTVLNDEINRR